MQRFKRFQWLVLALLCLLMMGAEGDCVSGAGTECSSDKACEEYSDEHYCAPCGKCVLVDNAESEAFWCSHEFSRSYASDDNIDDQCGDYSDDGIYNTQAKSFCQTAYMYECSGDEPYRQETCDTLRDVSTEAHANCPYC